MKITFLRIVCSSIATATAALLTVCFLLPSFVQAAAGNTQVDIGKITTNAGVELKADIFDGSLDYQLPLTIPPGRNGFQPALSFSYSSRPSPEANIFSRGWSISIPYIERRNYMGEEQLYDHPAFFSSLSGDLASTTDATIFKAKVDDGDYLDYRLTGNTWIVTDRQGLTYKFGNASSTQQYDPNDSQHIYKWMLQEVRDLNGNYITYSYSKDNNQIYPATITYTGHDSTPGDFDIEFAKELRTDIATSTAEGFQVVTKYRINEIKAEVDDSWVHKYTIGYGTGDNGRRSIITSVTEAGNDGVSTITLPASTYGYQSSTDSWSESAWDIPRAFVSSGYVDEGVRLAEANGDGLPDLLYSNGDTPEVYLNTGSGWSLSGSWTIPVVFADSDVVHPPSLLIDINGDGLTDIASSTDSGSAIYMNTGSSWALASSTVPVKFADSSGNDQGVRVADVNGDGLPDLVHNTTWDGNKVYINNGSTWIYDPSWILPEPTAVRHGLSDIWDVGTRILDVNGDGLADIIRKDETINKVYINNGAEGWTLDSTWSIPVEFMDTGNDMGTRFEDINGDGLVDLINSQAINDTGVYLNTGAGWTYDSSWTIPVKLVDYVSSVYVDPASRMVDVDGDGLVDLLSYKQGSADKVYLHNGNKTDLLSSVTNPQGGVMTVTYQGSPEYTGLSPYLPFALDTVKSVAYNDGFATSTNDYSYEGGLYYVGNIRDRKFAGFGIISATDAFGNITKQYFHQGSTTSSTIGEYNDTVAKIGKIFRTEIYDNASHLFSKTISKWDQYDRGDGACFVKLTQTVDFSYDGDSDHKEKAESHTYNDAAGVPIQKIQWGEVSGSNDGTFSDSGSDKFTTSFTYATSTATSTVFALSDETTLDQSSSKVRETKTLYDTLSFGSLNKGNPTTQSQWKTSSTYIDTGKTYNSYGLVTSATDGRNKTTSYAYEPLNLYIATTTNQLSQETVQTHDYSSGKVTQTTDPNTRVFQTLYDALDRVVEEKQPDITAPASLITKTTYSYTDTGFPKKVLKTDYLGSATSTVIYIYSDGFGKKVEERAEAEGSNYAVKDYQYDTRGLLKNESLPFFDTATSYTGTSSPPTSSLLTHYTYDPLKRITTIANSVGTTTNVYDDWKTTVTDAESNAKDFIKDAYANLISVVEHNDASSYTTTYEYNGNGKLTKITDDTGNVRNFTYDGLGRRLTAEDLHDTSDGTYGSWSYSYDDTSNLSSYTDPKSQTVNFTYDDINRTLTENYTGTGGTEVEYAYDSCTEGIGHLCIATTTAAVSSFTYNALGLPTAKTQRISSTNYATLFTYDRLGNITGITYPDNFQVAYGYNAAGQLETVSQKEPSGSFIPLITDFDYAPTGKVSYKEFANGVTSTYTYDSNHLYRLTNILTIDTDGDSLRGGGGEDELSLADYSSHYALAEALPYAFASLQLLALDDESPFDSLLPEVPQPEETPVPQENETTPPDDSVPPSIPEPEAPASEPAPEAPKEDPVPTPEIPEVPTDFATTTDPLPEELPLQLTDALMLKAPVEDLLGSKEFADGTVKYAYKTDVSIDSVPVSEEAQASIEKQGLSITDEVVDKRTSHSRTFATENRTIFVLEAVSGDPQYYKDENGEWWQADYATTTKAAYDFQTKPKDEGVIDKVISFFKRILFEPAYAASTTFYPDPSTEVTSVDGFIRNKSSSWSTTRTASAGDVWADSNSDDVVAYSGKVSTNYYIYRGFFLFDTSALPDTDTIVSATMSLYVTSKQDQDNDGNDFMNVYTSSPASNTALVSGDYDQVGSTAQATAIDITSITTSAYNTFTLNATGLGNISKTGVTKFGTREGHDVNDDTVANASQNEVYVRLAEYTGTSNDPKLTVVYTSAPDVPTSLQTEGQSNPSYVLDSTPEFSAVFQDPNAGDLGTSYQIQVSTSTSFTSPYWDSAKLTLSSTTPIGVRSPQISYAGSTLASSTPYYWRVKFWDDGNVAGAWSTDTATFTLAQDEAAAGDLIQNISYTYDNVGNITQVTDISGTGAAKTVLYGYDDLSRLITASTTVASSTPFSQTYAYNSIGNITSKSDVGSYTYSETNYANPNAPTTINGTTLAYDNNGNLTSYGAAKLYNWDYRNHLSEAGNGTATSTYAYDYTGERVNKVSGGITTIYSDDYWNKANATSTRQIYAGGELVAIVQGNGTATTTQYAHNDHLGGINDISDSNGDVMQVLDYYPYGSTRINTGTYDSQRTYIGEAFDSESNLSYLNARYLSSAQGQFLSEDPAFLAIGNSGELKRLTQQDQDLLITNPQALNSYSYAGGNPIINKDPSGLCLEPASAIACVLAAYTVASIGVDVYDSYNTSIRYKDFFSQEEKDKTNFKLGLDVALAAVGGKVVEAGGKAAGVGFDTLTATLDVLDTYFSKQIYQKYNEDHSPNKEKKGSVLPDTKTYATSNQGSYQYSSSGGNKGISYTQLSDSLSKLVASLRSYVVALPVKKSKN